MRLRRVVPLLGLAVTTFVVASEARAFASPWSCQAEPLNATFSPATTFVWDGMSPSKVPIKPLPNGKAQSVSLALLHEHDIRAEAALDAAAQPSAASDSFSVLDEGLALDWTDETGMAWNLGCANNGPYSFTWESAPAHVECSVYSAESPYPLGSFTFTEKDPLATGFAYASTSVTVQGQKVVAFYGEDVYMDSPGRTPFINELYLGFAAPGSAPSPSGLAYASAFIQDFAGDSFTVDYQGASLYCDRGPFNPH